MIQWGYEINTRVVS